MLECHHRDGRARILEWQPGNDGSKTGNKAAPKAATPALIWPQTTFGKRPDWIPITLALQPEPGEATIQLQSGGTWFHPRSSHSTAPSAANMASLLVPPLRPAPTTTVQTVHVSSELSILFDAAGWASNPKDLVPALIQARQEAASRALWLPGLGTPQDYALWTYLGCDLFDASTLLRAAVRGQVLTTDGVLDLEAAGRTLGDGEVWTTEEALKHNLEAARRELALVHESIRTGTLRALVERRIYTKASQVEILRRFDAEHDYLEAAAPHHRGVALPCMTIESLLMPEVESFRRRMRQDYEPPAADVLVLFPCSARKPYKTSRSHRAYARVLDDSGLRHRLHEVMITSPLGLVPRDLEEVYPANAYDIPVTGSWTHDEQAIVREQLRSLLSKRSYAHVVVHASAKTFEVLRDLLPSDAVHTVATHPTDRNDLQTLAAELARLKTILGQDDLRRVGNVRKLADLQALASFQFGAAVAADLCREATARGHAPFIRLEGPEGQRAMTTAGRGLLSLTMHGAEFLSRHGRNRVFIENFTPKGTSSLFAVGVTHADPNVRVGDEVVVQYGDDARACGVAAMPAAEMGAMKRGMAVQLRHTASPEQAQPKQEVAA